MGTKYKRGKTIYVVERTNTGVWEISPEQLHYVQCSKYGYTATHYMIENVCYLRRCLKKREDIRIRFPALEKNPRDT